jgi:YbbR domain-containing protein
MSKEKNDLTLKIFAFTIAIVLWGYVMSIENPDITKSYSIALTLNNMDELDRQGLIVMEPKEANISVKVTGRKSDMANFSPDLIKAQADLSGYGEGKRKVPVNVSLNQFNNIKIVNYEPKETLFIFDKIITRDKTVTIKTSGKVESGYVLGDITTKSGSILLKGPRTWVNQVSEVVAVVDIAGMKDDNSKTAVIQLVDDQGNNVRGVEKEPNTVDVDISIFRTVNVPIELKTENQLPDQYEITNITIDPRTVTLKGDKNIVNLRSIQTKAIDINSLIENTTQTVELELPPNVSLLNPNEKITISLNIEEISTRVLEYTLEDIDMLNLDTDLIIDKEHSQEPIHITVKGNSEVVERLNKEDLGLYLDLLNLNEGIHEVLLGFNAPAGITVKEITPQPMELKLTKH